MPEETSLHCSPLTAWQSGKWNFARSTRTGWLRSPVDALQCGNELLWRIKPCAEAIPPGFCRRAHRNAPTDDSSPSWRPWQLCFSLHPHSMNEPIRNIWAFINTGKKVIGSTWNTNRTRHHLWIKAMISFSRWNETHKHKEGFQPASCRGLHILNAVLLR